MNALKKAYNRVRFGITPEMLTALHEAEKRPIAPDEDAPELSEAELAEFARVRGRPKKAARKERIDVLLEPESARYLRKSGDGWQTRLCEYIESGIARGVL